MPHVTSFRSWLLLRLVATGMRQPTDQSDREFARSLGIAPDLWREAKQQIAVRHKRPRQRPAAPLGTTTKKLQIEMPGAIYEAVTLYAKLQGVDPKVLIRSVADWVLRQPRVEVTGNYLPGAAWRFQGQDFVMPRPPDRTGRYRYTAYVSVGAYEALMRRAALLQTSVTALVRGPLLDLLEGRLREFRLVPIAAYMFDDLAKYVEYWE